MAISRKTYLEASIADMETARDLIRNVNRTFPQHRVGIKQLNYKLRAMRDHLKRMEARDE